MELPYIPLPVSFLVSKRANMMFSHRTYLLNSQSRGVFDGEPNKIKLISRALRLIQIIVYAGLIKLSKFGLRHKFLSHFFFLQREFTMANYEIFTCWHDRSLEDMNRMSSGYTVASSVLGIAHTYGILRSYHIRR